MSLKNVKGKIKSIDKTRKVTKAMEAVSAVKMRKSQEIALSARWHAFSAMKILQSVSGTVLRTAHPLMRERPVLKTCVIVITSDRGLAGSLNSQVFKKFNEFLKNINGKKENISVITIGRRGYEYFSKRGYRILDAQNGWGDFVDFSMVEPVVSTARNIFESGECDEVFIVYTNFISTLRQEVYFRKLLPLTFEGVKEAITGIIPYVGKYSSLRSGMEETLVEAYSFEPGPEAVLYELIPLLLTIEVYHSVLEANASEHSARMVAMKNASDNAEEILKNLRLSYNKARQATITKEMNEIVLGTLVNNQ